MKKFLLLVAAVIFGLLIWDGTIPVSSVVNALWVPVWLVAIAFGWAYQFYAGLPPFIVALILLYIFFQVRINKRQVENVELKSRVADLEKKLNPQKELWERWKKQCAEPEEEKKPGWRGCEGPAPTLEELRDLQMTGEVFITPRR
jgi:hypothetical protein